MRKIILVFTLLVTLSVQAQTFSVIRGGCTPDVDGDEVNTTRGVQSRKLPARILDWDPARTYRQLVILVDFKGDSTYFNMENPHETYDRMFNERGYNQRNGKGCVADYFRDQSGGLFNLQFDVFGPFDISLKAQPYVKPTENVQNTGLNEMKEATKMMIEENPGLDFSVYDWNGDGYVNQVIYVFAGYTGNVSQEIAFGYLWPNTGSFITTGTGIKTPSGQIINNYSASAECWPTTSKASCGIGTICHEYSHSLGLPDIYPTRGNVGYSVVDEWDLMDGGNFTNYGWCPPNYSALERMLLGWQTPIELTEATTVTDMKCVEDGGETYMIKHTDKEYYLLENHQWKGWDAGVPGKGLVIYHVNYNESKWTANRVNTEANLFGYSIVSADDMDYNDWDELLEELGGSQYSENPRMHNRHLSSSPYPWATDSTTFVNDQLTDTTVPASKMFNTNEEGSKYLSKAISNIRMSEDGLISFDFMGGDPMSVTLPSQRETTIMTVYDLGGHCMGNHLDSQRPGLYIVRYADGKTKKVVKR